MNGKIGLLLSTTSARLYNYMPFLISVGDFFQDIIDGFTGAIYTAVGFIFYVVTISILGISRIVFYIYYILVGLRKVQYADSNEYLINVFFENNAVDYVYRGMMVLGVVLCIAFTIAAVIRKTFDISDKNQTSFGGIIINAGKAILIMLVMTFVVTTTVNLSNVLIQRVSLLFDDSISDTSDRHVTFSNEDIAAMGRIYTTIGNYAVNPTYDSRYNINSCFNEIRSELQALKDKGLFDVHYVSYDAEGNEIDTWQSVLEKIIMSAPLNKNLTIDVYNDVTTKSIVYAMDILKSNKSFMPMSEYTQATSQSKANQEMNLDTILFLMGTGNAALNSDYNQNPSIHDKARSPFYEGEKSIYNISDVSESFGISFDSIDYLMIQISALAVLWQVLQIILNCVQRIFSMLVLYLAAPPIVSSMPFDEGAKFKQWVSAFVVQAFGIVGQVICMRVLMLFIQICYDNNLKLGGDGDENFLAQAVLVVCACFACRKASDILNGILSGNGGAASSAATSALGSGMSKFVSGMAMGKIMRSKEGAGKGAEDSGKGKNPRVLETDGDGKLPGKMGSNLGGNGGSGGKKDNSAGGGQNNGLPGKAGNGTSKNGEAGEASGGKKNGKNESGKTGSGKNSGENSLPQRASAGKDGDGDSEKSGESDIPNKEGNPDEGINSKDDGNTDNRIDNIDGGNLGDGINQDNKDELKENGDNPVEIPDKVYNNEDNGLFADNRNSGDDSENAVQNSDSDLPNKNVNNDSSQNESIGSLGDNSGSSLQSKKYGNSNSNSAGYKGNGGTNNAVGRSAGNRGNSGNNTGTGISGLSNRNAEMSIPAKSSAGTGGGKENNSSNSSLGGSSKKNLSEGSNRGYGVGSAGSDYMPADSQPERFYSASQNNDSSYAYGNDIPDSIPEKTFSNDSADAGSYNNNGNDYGYAESGESVPQHINSSGYEPEGFGEGQAYNEIPGNYGESYYGNNDDNSYPAGYNDSSNQNSSYGINAESDNVIAKAPPKINRTESDSYGSYNHNVSDSPVNESAGQSSYISNSVDSGAYANNAGNNLNVTSPNKAYYSDEAGSNGGRNANKDTSISGKKVPTIPKKKEKK